MASPDHHPVVIPHTLTSGHMNFSMFPNVNEVHMVTTTYPVKDFVGRVETHPCYVEGQHNQYGHVHTLPLDHPTAALVLNHTAVIMLTNENYLREFLNTRVMFWNCTGVNLDNYRSNISHLHGGYGFDVAIILGGMAEDDDSEGFWTNLGLTGSFISKFGGVGPNVTVKWDRSVVGVVTFEHLEPSAMGTRSLVVRVHRCNFNETIESSFGRIVSPDGSPDTHVGSTVVSPGSGDEQ